MKCLFVQGVTRLCDSPDFHFVDFLFFQFDKFWFIGLFNHIIQLQYMQEQSRQILLPGLKLFYEPPPFARRFFLLLKTGGGHRGTLLVPCSIR